MNANARITSLGPDDKPCARFGGVGARLASHAHAR